MKKGIEQKQRASFRFALSTTYILHFTYIIDKYELEE